MKRVPPTAADLLDKAENWQQERRTLRSILLDCELSENVKWGKLCYTYEGTNVVMIYGLKEHCALSFFKGALLKDAGQILIKPGENSQAMRWMKFSGLEEITGMEAVVKTYVQEAIDLEKAGLKVDFKEKNELVFPKELHEKLDGNPALKAAFDALTPGRKRGYNLYFSAPRQSKTRTSRIEKCSQNILDGKGLNDR